MKRKKHHTNPTNPANPTDRTAMGRQLVSLPDFDSKNLQLPDIIAQVWPTS